MYQIGIPKTAAEADQPFELRKSKIPGKQPLTCGYADKESDTLTVTEE